VVPSRFASAVRALVALAALGPAAAAAAGLELVRTLPWSGAGGVTLQEAARERPARGPQGVAAEESGALLVVDTLARRVVRVAAEGPPEVVWAGADTLEPVAAIAV